MILKTQSSPLTAQVTATMLAQAAVWLLIVVGFVSFATIRADQASLERQKVQFADAIAGLLDTLAGHQQLVTASEEFGKRVATGDEIWMAQNVGSRLHIYNGHDRVYLLDPDGRPVHALVDGLIVEPSAYAQDEADLARLVAAARGLAGSRPRPLPAPLDKMGVSDFVSVGSRPALAAVRVVGPGINVADQTGQGYLHIALRFIDQPMVDGIADRLVLSGARVVPAGDRPDASVPLVDSAGTLLGHVAWTPAQPGLEIVQEAAPVMALGVLLAVTMLVFLIARLRRASLLLQRSKQEAQYLALHDTLTGLPNRTLFDDRLRQALADPTREDGRVALLYLDLDRFKHVNDTFGHPVGDELVRQVAARLQQTVRDRDTVARLGGDEFAIIVAGVRDTEVVEELCLRLLARLEQGFNLMGNHVHVGTSIGVAISADKAMEPSDLLRKADIALYEAKKNGRGRHQVFAGDMDSVLLRKRLIEADLRRALKAGGGGQLRLIFQPVYARDCVTLVGAEALPRWRHPVNGEFQPGQFIPIAEERGIVGSLGRWIMNEAIAFAARSQLPWIAVNVSPLQLREEGFPLSVMSMLAEHGVRPERLQIEVTETALLENGLASSAALAELRAAGVRVALDDFGTGYSSISYLRRHTIDKLKIDHSFVRQLGRSETATALVRALIDMAAALRVDVTAEGVETEAQRDMLVAMGCRELQGFLLSRPLEADEISAMESVLDPSERRLPSVAAS